jgi:FkbH-like protein
MAENASRHRPSILSFWRSPAQPESRQPQAPEQHQPPAFQMLFKGETAAASPTDIAPAAAPASPPPAPAKTTPQPPPQPKHLPKHVPKYAPKYAIDPIAYLTPTDLQLTPPGKLRILAVGSCLLQDLLDTPDKKHGDVEIDFALSGFVNELANDPPSDIASYDCQVFQMALRSLIPDTLLTELPTATPADQQAAFAQSCDRMERYLKAALKWNVAYGLPTFVMNFMQPQFNRMGRFQHRFSLGNLEYYVMMLNQHLEHLVSSYKNCHIFDIDRIAASFGRRFLQDDLIFGSNHNARLKPQVRADGRIEQIGIMAQTYEVQPNGVLRQAIIAELRALHITMRQTDSVKLVVLDLDDTLWQGVSGDTADIGPHMAEGYPQGLIEALHILRARGILLAIISKNNETRIRDIWPKIFGNRLKLEHFAAVKINWRPKHENMREILQAMNLLAKSVLFIDDNPVERAHMQAEHPDIRVLTGNIFLWKRTLLLAPELQVTTVTAESTNRTAMMQAQLQRESERKTLSAEEFLRSQEIRVTLSAIRSDTDPRFARALELINKTNQFNTTGQRWTARELGQFLTPDNTLAVYDVEDRYTPYGLVGVALLKGSHIAQWVMSCRVIGFGVEQVVLSALVHARRLAHPGPISATLAETEMNHPCRGLFATAGFEKRLEGWVLNAEMTPDASPFIELRNEIAVGS